MNSIIFVSKLTDRIQYAVYDKAKSDFAVIKTRVPKGYVLGLLFFVYVNDIPTAGKLSKFIMHTK